MDLPLLNAYHAMNQVDNYTIWRMSACVKIYLLKTTELAINAIIVAWTALTRQNIIVLNATILKEFLIIIQANVYV